jgi:outer membrane protein TolC
VPCSTHAIQSDSEALKPAVAFEHAAKRNLDLAQKQFEVGYVNYLSLLSTEHAYHQAVINLAHAKAICFAGTAALFMALGGVLWNGPDDTSAPVTSVAFGHR